MRMRTPPGSFTCTSSSACTWLTAIFGAASSSPISVPRTSTGASIFNCSGKPLVVARKADQLDLAGRVFERRLRIELLVALALLHAQPVNHAGHLNLVRRIRLPAPAPLRRLALQRLGHA